MPDALRAYAFVRWRSLRRFLASLARRPVTLAAIAAAILAARAGGLSGDGGRGAFVAAHADLLDFAALGVLATVALLILAAVAGSPFRWSMGDAAWLSAAPGGLRVLVAGEAVGSALLALVLGGGWAVLAAALGPLDLGSAAAVAAAAAALTASVRAVSVIAHVLAQRGRLGRGLRGAGGVGLALAAAGGVLLAVGADGGVRPIVEPVRAALVDPLALALFRPSVADTLPLLAVCGAAMAAALIAALWGGEATREAGADMAREMQALVDTVGEEWSPTTLFAASIPSGTPSWRRGARLVGDRALAYRALCHERRLRRRTVVAAGILAGAGALLALLAPAAAPAVAAAAVLATTGGAFAGPMALELGTPQLALMSGRRTRQLAWLHAPRAACDSLVLAAAWLPVGVLGAVPPGLAVAGLLCAPLVAIVMAMSSCLTALLGGALVTRMWTLVLLGGVPLAAALGPLGAFRHLSLAVPLTGAMATTCLSFAALYLMFSTALLDARDRRRA